MLPDSHVQERTIGFQQIRPFLAVHGARLVQTHDCVEGTAEGAADVA